MACALLLPNIASANMPVPPNMIYCNVGETHLTTYESTAPRIFEQKLVLKDKGTYWVTARAQGFTFEGHVFARKSHMNKWTSIAKTARGRQSWTRRWQVGDDAGSSYLRLQLIKDSAACPGCIIHVEVKSECPNSL